MHSGKIIVELDLFHCISGLQVRRGEASLTDHFKKEIYSADQKHTYALMHLPTHARPQLYRTLCSLNCFLNFHLALFVDGSMQAPDDCIFAALLCSL